MQIITLDQLAHVTGGCQCQQAQPQLSAPGGDAAGSPAGAAASDGGGGGGGFLGGLSQVIGVLQSGGFQQLLGGLQGILGQFGGQPGAAPAGPTAEG